MTRAYYTIHMFNIEMLCCRVGGVMMEGVLTHCGYKKNSQPLYLHNSYTGKTFFLFQIRVLAA